MRYAYMGELGGAAWTDWLAGAGAIVGIIAKIGAKGAAETAIAEGKSAEEARAEGRAAGIAAVEAAKALEVGVPASRIALYVGGGIAATTAIGALAWYFLKK